MSNINEKIYQFVSERNEPVSISMIASDKAFSIVSRREIGAALIQLQKESALFRILKDGKAYYSTSVGEDLNPIQKNILETQKKLQNAFGGSGSNDIDAIKALGDAFKALIGTDDEKSEDEDYSEYALTYLGGNRFSSKEFSIAIPDGYKQAKETKGREFILYSPAEEDPEDYAITATVFYCEQAKPSSVQVYLPEILLYANEKSLWTSYEEIGLQGEIIRFSAGNVKGFYAYQDYGFGVNYMIFFPERANCGRILAVKVMPIENQKKREACDKMVMDWVSTIRLNNEIPQRVPLTDSSFLDEALSKKSVDKWFEYAQTWLNQYKARMMLGMQLEIAKFNQLNDRFSFVKIRPLLTTYIKECEESVNLLFKEISDVVVSKGKANNADKKFLYLHKKAKELLSVVDDKVTIDEYEIKVNINSKKTASAITTSRVKKILDDEKQAAEKKKAAAEQKKKKLEEDAKNKIEQSTALFKQFRQQAEDNAIALKSNLTARVQQFENDEKSRLNARIGQAEMLIEESKLAIKSFGLFAFSGKKVWKDKIADSKSVISSCRAELEALPAKCAQMKRAIDPAVEEYKKSTHDFLYTNFVPKNCPDNVKMLLGISAADQKSPSAQDKDEEMKNAVYMALVDHGFVGAEISQLIDHPYLKDYRLTTQKLSRILSKLIAEGCVCKSKYFGLLRYHRIEAASAAIDNNVESLTNTQKENLEIKAAAYRVLFTFNEPASVDAIIENLEKAGFTSLTSMKVTPVVRALVSEGYVWMTTAKGRTYYEPSNRDIRIEDYYRGDILIREGSENKTLPELPNVNDILGLK